MTRIHVPLDDARSEATTEFDTEPSEHLSGIFQFDAASESEADLDATLQATFCNADAPPQALPTGEVPSNSAVDRLTVGEKTELTELTPSSQDLHKYSESNVIVPDSVDERGTGATTSVEATTSMSRTSMKKEPNNSSLSSQTARNSFKSPSQMPNVPHTSSHVGIGSIRNDSTNTNYSVMRSGKSEVAINNVSGNITSDVMVVGRGYGRWAPAAEAHFSTASPDSMSAQCGIPRPVTPPRLGVAHVNVRQLTPSQRGTTEQQSRTRPPTTPEGTHVPARQRPSSAKTSTNLAAISTNSSQDSADVAGVVANVAAESGGPTSVAPAKTAVHAATRSRGNSTTATASSEDATTQLIWRLECNHATEMSNLRTELNLVRREVASLQKNFANMQNDRMLAGMDKSAAPATAKNAIAQAAMTQAVPVHMPTPAVSAVEKDMEKFRAEFSGFQERSSEAERELRARATAVEKQLRGALAALRGMQRPHNAELDENNVDPTCSTIEGLESSFKCNDDGQMEMFTALNSEGTNKRDIPLEVRTQVAVLDRQVGHLREVSDDVKAVTEDVEIAIRALLRIARTFAERLGVGSMLVGKLKPNPSLAEEAEAFAAGIAYAWRRQKAAGAMPVDTSNAIDALGQKNKVPGSVGFPLRAHRMVIAQARDSGL